MTFKHKLSVRLALMRDARHFSKRMTHSWRERAPFLAALFPVLPINVNLDHILAVAGIAILVKLWRGLTRELIWSDYGQRRRRPTSVTERRRLSDRHPCWEVFLPRTPWLVRLSLLTVHKAQP